jgi:hypothetical protein
MAEKENLEEQIDKVFGLEIVVYSKSSRGIIC